MSKGVFEKRFNDLKNKHGLFWTWSCDLLSVADVLVYKDDSDSDDSLITTIGINTPEGREKGIEDIEQYFVTK